MSNDHGAAATITSSTRTTTPTMVNAVVPANGSLQFVEYFKTQPGAHVQITINSTWAGDNYSQSNSATVNKNSFNSNCLPDDLSKNWNFVFKTLPEDCLPTLALTGGSVQGGALGLSALLTLGGILLIAGRRREKADLAI